MSAEELMDTARALVACDKGLLAMDESTPTCNKRFAQMGIPQTEDARLSYRELIVTRCLLRAVPAAVPGIAFLSGGQSAERASIRLNAMNVRFTSRLPWALAFSYGRAIQQPALEIWHSEEAHVTAAQQALMHRARCNRAARRGEYQAAMDRTSA